MKMISRIDHVSIAVKDYEKAVNLFQKVLGAIPGYVDEDSNLKFYWRVLSLGDLSRLEIIKPSGKGSFLDNFLQNKNGGVHHITLQTPDIQQAKKTLQDNYIPYFGYNEYDEFYWKEIFIHPKDAFGVLIQIAEFNPNDWLDKSVKLSAGRKWSVKKSAGGCTLTFSHPGGGKTNHELTKEEIKKLVHELNQLC
jgi:methylmalonyl-CoA/ethylmalonyl-CoA epimerase